MYRSNLHIEHSIRGLNRNVAILLNMQSRSLEATVTLHQRGVAASGMLNLQSRVDYLPQRRGVAASVY